MNILHLGFERKCIWGISPRPVFPNEDRTLDVLKEYDALASQTQPPTLFIPFPITPFHILLPALPFFSGIALDNALFTE